MREQAAHEQRTDDLGVVSIEHVNLRLRRDHVLKDVSLDVEPGEFFAFLGPSGSGKTTLLRLIAGFGQPTAGRILIGGARRHALPPWKRNVGMVFQSYALWPHMTVARTSPSAWRSAACRRAPRSSARARRWSSSASRIADRRPAQLSGGQQQRVALARTIAIEPRCCCSTSRCPTSTPSCACRCARAARLQRKLGITTIFVTHDQEEANAVATASRC
jgi:iron(III) transport system ATP-binding protein